MVQSSSHSLLRSSCKATFFVYSQCKKRLETLTSVFSSVVLVSVFVTVPGVRSTEVRGVGAEEGLVGLVSPLRWSDGDGDDRASDGRS